MNGSSPCPRNSLLPVLCLWAAIGPVTLPAGEESPTTRCLLSVDLADGSRVIGVPAIASVPIQTPYAKLDVRLVDVRAIAIGADHERATFELANGDRLSGVWLLGEVELTTPFGKHAIPARHIRSIAVRSGKLDLEGLVLRHTFDDVQGDRVPDASGKRNHGQLRGATVNQEGGRGGVCRMDGKGAYVVLPDAAKQTGPFTVSLWFTYEPTGDNGALYGGGGLDTASDRNGIAITWFNAQNVLYLDLYGTPGRYAATFARTQVDFTDGKWHHVVGTYDGEEMAIYVDGWGGPENRKRIGPVKIDWTTSDHFLGRRAERAGQTWYWKGCVDELTIFSRALSREEVGDLRAMGRKP